MKIDSAEIRLVRLPLLYPFQISSGTMTERHFVLLTHLSQAFGAPVWCGGMLESGIGRAHNIHLSTLENFTKPGDTSSSSRYWKQNIIDEALEVENGMMDLPAGPGIGVTLNMPALETVTESTEVIR